eukprot:1407268-Prymnesium_polylepis.1
MEQHPLNIETGALGVKRKIAQEEIPKFLHDSAGARRPKAGLRQAKPSWSGQWLHGRFVQRRSRYLRRFQEKQP